VPPPETITITDRSDAPPLELADQLAGLALFADLSRPELESVAHTLEEAWFPAGQRVLRQGFTGTGFYVILDGDVAIRIDGEERARLRRGDFFGEVSALLGEAPVADVVALGPLRVLHLAGPDLREFLLAHPQVLLRMLVDQTRRLRTANQWRR
jgi:CRP/FNR family transcriptional regulator, cyclic AMP receptor protein